jgi:hypothetical protein
MIANINAAMPIEEESNAAGAAARCGRGLPRRGSDKEEEESCVTAALVDQLYRKIEMLEEESRQLRGALAPDAIDVPARWG